jgi:threonine aldolase
MLYFENDYCEGAHPAILQKLTETNFEKVSGYGTDPYCASAREKIRAACACPEADVQFISGGTQSNAIVIASMLQRWQGVVAAATGHVAGHEAGAIEYTGHKVITLPQHNGKLDAAELRALVATFYADDNHDHMVFPGMVYISHRVRHPVHQGGAGSPARCVSGVQDAAVPRWCTAGLRSGC